jgi:ribonuclease-3 family protein
MNDNLLPAAAGLNADELTSVALAYVGDAVFTLHVRTRLAVAASRPQHELHRLASEDVRAAAQAHWLELLEDKLSAEEKTIVRWARNARIGKGGGGTPAERHHATAFEALLGHLYLSGRTARLRELLDSLTTNPAPESGG